MASYNGNKVDSSISKIIGMDRFCPEDVSLLENMVLKMENRMVKEYDEMTFRLSALLNTSLAKQDQLENNIKEMQAEVRELCAFLKHDSDGFMTVPSSTSGDAKEDHQGTRHETESEFDNGDEQITEGEEEVIPVVSSHPDLSHGFKNLSVDDAASAAAAAGNSLSAPVGCIPIPVPNFETTIVKESLKEAGDSIIGNVGEDPPKPKVFDVVDANLFSSSSSESAKPALGPKKQEWSQDRIKTQKKAVQLRAKQEAPGKSLEEVSIRIFDGFFDFDVSGRKHKVRFTLVRNQKDKYYELMVCFPHVPPRPGSSDSVEAHFGNFTVNYEFLNLTKHPVVSDSFEMDAGDGTCLLPDANPDQHLQCPENTWTIEIENPNYNWFNWMDDKCVQTKFLPNTGNQAYFINANFEFIPRPPSADTSLPEDGNLDTAALVDNNDDTPIIAPEEVSAQSVHEVTVTGRKEADTKTDTTPALSSISSFTSVDFEDDVHENLDHIGSDDLSPEARKAFEDWRNNRSVRFTWFDETNLNIELLLFSYEKSIESFQKRCAQNLMAAKSLSVDELTLIKDLAGCADLVELDEFCSHKLIGLID